MLQSDNPAVGTLYLRQLTLIRPDQHIAWAGDSWPAREDFDVLAMATGQLPDAETDTNRNTQKEKIHEANA